MKRILIIIFAFFWSTLCLAQTTAETDTSANKLEDVVVQTTYQGSAEEDKLPLLVNFDYSHEAVIENRVSWNSLDQFENEAGESDESASFALHFSQPEYARIQPAPVKSFRVQFKKLQRWQLDITSSDGSLFRQIRGEGNPPENVTWDGMSDNDVPLHAGQNYAYSFLAVDEAGNKRIFPGNSFNVPAFNLVLGDTLLIGLGRATLFSADGLRLLPDARDYAREVATLIRFKDDLREVQVAVPSPAGERFLQMVADELVVETNFFIPLKTTHGDQLGVVFYLLAD
ncbi:MAG: hypothetical protein H6696_12290 [Deferribacteres bacterium]|nr:hypothetical protein [Deferribacteres bacterium]